MNQLDTLWFINGELFKQMVDEITISPPTTNCSDCAQYEYYTQLLNVLPESTKPFTKNIPELLYRPLTGEQYDELCESWVYFISAANYWIVEDIDFPQSLISGINNIIHLPETHKSKLCDSISFSRPKLTKVICDIYDLCRTVPSQFMDKIVETSIKHDYLYLVQLTYNQSRHKCSIPHAINVCCQYGSIDCLCYLCGLDRNAIDYTNICERSAYYGHLECLRFAHENGGELKSNPYYNWSSGNLPCIKYLWEHTPPYEKQIGYRILEMFVYCNHNDCLKWGLSIRSQHYSSDIYELLKTAINSKHMDCFKQLIDMVDVLSHNQLMRIIQHACRKNQPECLSMLYCSERSPFLPVYNFGIIQPLINAYEIAAESGSLECMKIINHEFGIKFPTKQTLLSILQEDHVHCLKYWLDTFPEMVLGSNAVFRYMYSNTPPHKCFEYAYTQKMRGYLHYIDDPLIFNLLPRISYDEYYTWYHDNDKNNYSEAMGRDEWPSLSEFTWVPHSFT